MPIRQRLALTLAASVACAHAASLAQLIPQSDAIVIGSLSSAAVVGTTAILSITVERVFTGSVGVGSEIAALWSIPRGSHVTPSSSYSQRGIWFLQRAPDGSWACITAASYGNKRANVADIPLPVSPGPLPASLAYDSSNTALLDQLTLEVAATQPSDPMVVLNSLAGNSDAAATQALHYIAGTPGDFGLSALAGLVGRGDVPSLLQVEQMASSLATASSGAQMLVSTIGGVRNTDASSVASLGRMATSPNSSAELQLAATQALKAIHTAAAMPYLGTLATGNNTQLQLPAAQGISFFVNGVDVQTSATAASMAWLGSGQPSGYATTDTQQHLGYRIGQGESAYIAYWQSWWQRHPQLH